MIQYSLKCAEGHSFDSWFQSASAFDKLAAVRMVECVVCGGTDVEKAVMAPRVASSDRPAAPGTPALRDPADPRARALAELRRRIEAESEYVGPDFVREARAMHLGDAPERAIHGEARLDEARKLAEEGVPIAPLPFRPKHKEN